METNKKIIIYGIISTKKYITTTDFILSPGYYTILKEYYKEKPLIIKWDDRSNTITVNNENIVLQDIINVSEVNGIITLKSSDDKLIHTKYIETENIFKNLNDLIEYIRIDKTIDIDYIIKMLNKYNIEAISQILTELNIRNIPYFSYLIEINKLIRNTDFINTNISELEIYLISIKDILDIKKTTNYLSQKYISNIYLNQYIKNILSRHDLLESKRSNFFYEGYRKNVFYYNNFLEFINKEENNNKYTIEYIRAFFKKELNYIGEARYGLFSTSNMSFNLYLSDSQYIKSLKLQLSKEYTIITTNYKYLKYQQKYLQLKNSINFI